MFIGEFFALGAALCWAIGPLLAYAGVERLGTFRFSMMRFALSAFALGILAAATGQLTVIDSSAFWTLVASGILGVAFGEACLFQAVFLLGPRIASVVFSMHAPITALLGGILFREVVSFNQLAGIVIAAVGVTLAITFRSASEKLGGKWHKARPSSKGLILALLAVAFQVCGALLSKAGVASVEPIAASFIRTASAAIAFIPIFLLFRERDKEVSPSALKYVAYSAGISTIGGMTFLLAAFANTEIYKAVMISSLAPVLFILIMTVFGRERFPILAWCGTIMAVAGIAISLS